MKKREALRTLLAGLIAINTLGGCASEKHLKDISKSDINEEVNNEQEMKVDVIELSNEECVSEEFVKNNVDLIEHFARVTSVDLSNDPVYIRANIILNEGLNSNKSVKEVYTSLNDINNNNHKLDNYVIVNDIAYKVDIVESYQAIISEKEGQTIYSAPYGGIISGTTATKTTTLNEEVALIFLLENNYINNDNAKLKNTF